METVVTATEFHARDDRPEWRYALGRLEAWYRCGTFASAGALATEIAAAAERAGHHPDLDVRYPIGSMSWLATHAVDAVTELDVGLAGEISGPRRGGRRDERAAHGAGARGGHRCHRH